jgi:hypothetical protein
VKKVAKCYLCRTCQSVVLELSLQFEDGSLDKCFCNWKAVYLIWMVCCELISRGIRPNLWLRFQTSVVCDTMLGHGSLIFPMTDSNCSKGTI